MVSAKIRGDIWTYVLFLNQAIEIQAEDFSFKLSPEGLHRMLQFLYDEDYSHPVMRSRLNDTMQKVL